MAAVVLPARGRHQQRGAGGGGGDAELLSQLSAEGDPPFSARMSPVGALLLRLRLRSASSGKVSDVFRADPAVFEVCVRSVCACVCA